MDAGPVQQQVKMRTIRVYIVRTYSNETSTNTASTAIYYKYSRITKPIRTRNAVLMISESYHKSYNTRDDVLITKAICPRDDVLMISEFILQKRKHQNVYVVLLQRLLNRLPEEIRNGRKSKSWTYHVCVHRAILHCAHVPPT